MIPHNKYATVSIDRGGNAAPARMKQPLINRSSQCLAIQRAIELLKKSQEIESAQCDTPSFNFAFSALSADVGRGLCIWENMICGPLKPRFSFAHD